MPVATVNEVVTYFLELYHNLNTIASQDSSPAKPRDLARRFRAYSRGVSEDLSTSPAMAVLHLLSKGTVNCVLRVLFDYGFDIHGRPSVFLDRIIWEDYCKSSDKLVYATLFSAALTVYSSYKGFGVSSVDDVVQAIKDLLSELSDPASPFPGILEELFIGVKKAAEAALSEEYE